MRRQGALRIVVMITIIGMMISSLPMGYEKGGLDESQERREQLGPDEPTLEERCSGLTYEDMFEYTKAVFNFTNANDSFFIDTSYLG